MAADSDFDELRRTHYVENRIPPLDALEVFVPAGKENDRSYGECLSRPSRWFPVEGGHRVLVLHERGDYDPHRFSLLKGAWDHEHCKFCQGRIEAMTLCWISERGPVVILCADCHARVRRSRSRFSLGHAIRRIFRK